MIKAASCALILPGMTAAIIPGHDRATEGKRLTGKLYEPFERADGGRASRLDLLRLYI
jgi:hypothetical protein